MSGSFSKYVWVSESADLLYLLSVADDTIVAHIRINDYLFEVEYRVSCDKWEQMLFNKEATIPWLKHYVERKLDIPPFEVGTYNNK